MGVHVTQKSPQAGEFLPGIPGHLGKQGSFSMNDFIVGKGQDKIFRIGISHGEGQLIVIVTAVDRIFGKIQQGVVHPAHIPLEAETQAIKIDRGRHPAPIRGFFGDGETAGKRP